MKLSKKLVAGFVLAALVFWVPKVQAGVPLNNLEGAGGVAFNPLAYLAGSSSDDRFQAGQGKFRIEKLGIAKPQIGSWYVNLKDSKVDWASLSIADSFFKRLEVSYGFEAIGLSAGEHRHKQNFGSKLLLVPENWNGHQWIPAVSAGSIIKHTTNVGPGLRSTGIDGYLVATKLIAQLPLPVLLSGGALITQGRATGVLGYDHRSDETLFANADVILNKWVAVGYEFKEGAKFSSFKNANYWDTHLAFMPNKKLTLVAAFVNAGNQDRASGGLGNGVTVSLHYAF